MTTMNAPTVTTTRTLTLTEFDQLAAMPPELEWFANIRNPNTRRTEGEELFHRAWGPSPLPSPRGRGSKDQE